MSLDLALYVDVDTGASQPHRAYITDWLNATHNVIPMWQLAGVYDALYNSDGTHAGDWIGALRVGVADMQDRPAVYEVLNPPNGWGRYSTALRFLEAWTGMCAAHPKALIEVSK